MFLLKSCSWLSEIITVGVLFFIAHDRANKEGVASHPLKIITSGSICSKTSNNLFLISVFETSVIGLSLKRVVIFLLFSDEALQRFVWSIEEN